MFPAPTTRPGIRHALRGRAHRPLTASIDPVVLIHRVVAVLATLLLTLAATVAVGAQSATAAPDLTAAQHSDAIVSITDSLSPAHVGVEPGDTVTWVNDDTDPHRLMSVIEAGTEFDPGVLQPGEQWSHTFDSAGDVTHHDHAMPRTRRTSAW